MRVCVGVLLTRGSGVKGALGVRGSSSSALVDNGESPVVRETTGDSCSSSSLASLTLGGLVGVVGVAKLRPLIVLPTEHTVQ